MNIVLDESGRRGGGLEVIHLRSNLIQSQTPVTEVLTSGGDSLHIAWHYSITSVPFTKPLHIPVNWSLWKWLPRIPSAEPQVGI